ncbi:MAG TPA: MFS transporter, partial [Candidatus Methylacidiphilales bacterium]
MTSLPPTAAPKLWRAGTLVYTTGGLTVLFCLLLWGDFAWAMRDRVVPNGVQLLFKRFGASDTLVGILCSSLPAGIGLVFGPIVGYKSDRLRSRWGRRIPFLAIPTPFIVLSTVGLAFSPQIGAAAHHLLGVSGGGGIDGMVLIFMGLCWTTFEIACT